jgi:uncharacterized protein (TIGR00255 family)
VKTLEHGMALESMTGFAAVDGEAEGFRWRWELRSVNGKGLDLRLRLPEAWERHEAELRRRAGQALSRGSVTATLRIDAAAAVAGATDSAALDAAIIVARDAIRAAEAAGLPIAPLSPADLLRLAPGSGAARGADPADEALAAAALSGFDAALSDLVAARAGEGRALAATLARILDEIAAVAEAADVAHRAQLAAAPERLREKVRALQDAGAETPADRLAQELALIAVKADVREELDRLAAHIDAARALLAETGAVGRRLDFLTQEFNREANTLCSKSASTALTEAGLRLKVLIDQLREQAQNLA